MCLVWLSDNRLFAIACVRMWETQVITEDSAREFPQCRLWPRSVFRQLLFCVCASALHTPSQRTGEHYRYTAEHSNWEIKVLKASLQFYFYYHCYFSFVTQVVLKQEVLLWDTGTANGSPNSELLNTNGNYSKIHLRVVLHCFLLRSNLCQGSKWLSSKERWISARRPSAPLQRQTSAQMVERRWEKCDCCALIWVKYVIKICQYAPLTLEGC